MATPGFPISPRERGWIIATVMLGTVSTITAATIINVPFPALIAEFHVGHDSLQWVATGFLGAMTTTMLATAWLVEAHGQRRTFIAALAIFLASSALGAASFNPEVLIASRVLQGAAAGVLQPLAMIALFEVCPPERRGSTMGLFGLLEVLLEWRLGVHGAAGAATAFQECFWVVTMAFAAATAAAWSIRRHRSDNDKPVLR